MLNERREEIKATIEEGLVIMVDRGIKTLSIMTSQKDVYRDELFPYLLKYLKGCRPKDVSQRAEAILATVSRENKTEFIEVLQGRMADMRSLQEKRLKKVIAAVEI